MCLLCNKYSFAVSNAMGLYRRRIIRFILGIAVFIAIVQILTTLHFSSVYNGDVPDITRKKWGDINELHASSASVNIEDLNSLKTAGLDLRKSMVSARGCLLDRL